MVNNTTAAQKVIDFNNAHSYKIGVVSYECDFWNYDPDCASFDIYRSDLTWIKSYKKNFIVQVYVESVTQAELAVIKPLVSRILINDYVSQPADAFAYISDRLTYLAPINDNTAEVWPVFSAEPDYMGSWIQQWSPVKNGLTEAESTVTKALQASPLSSTVQLSGFQYFQYYDF